MGARRQTKKKQKVRVQVGLIARRQRQEAAHKGRKARKSATLAGLHSVRAQAVRRRPCCSSRPGWKKREIQDIFGAALSAIPSLRTFPLSLSASFSAAEHTWVYNLVAMTQQGDHSRRRANDRSRTLPPCDFWRRPLSAIPSLRTSPLSLSASFSAAEHTWVYTLVAMAQQGDHSRRRANRSRALPPCERAAATPLPAWRRAACDELTTVKIMIRTGALK